MAALDQVLARLEAEYRTSSREQLFDRLKALLADESGHPSQAQIARELGMTENAVKRAFDRLRMRYGELVREEISKAGARSNLCRG